MGFVLCLKRRACGVVCHEGRENHQKMQKIENLNRPSDIGGDLSFPEKRAMMTTMAGIDKLHTTRNS